MPYITSQDSPVPKPIDPTVSCTIKVADANLDLPRLLCLHGGGTNASIFACQMRVFAKHLQPYFRLVYTSAPHICSSPGADVERVYMSHGPFRRWLRWLPEHPEIGTESAVMAIDEAVGRAMEEDDERGGRGKWAGLLGFSQGAKVVGSLMLREQMRRDRGLVGDEGSGWKFAVLMAGSGPLVQLELGTRVKELSDAGALNVVEDREALEEEEVLTEFRRREGLTLRLPSVHVHGLSDPGLQRHRRLLWDWCEVGSARLVEWSGSHRVPIKRGDVESIVEKVLAVARETDSLRRN